MYEELRDNWIKSIICDDFTIMQPFDKIKLVLNQPKNVRQTVQFTVKAMDLGSKLNTQY